MSDWEDFSNFDLAKIASTSSGMDSFLSDDGVEGFDLYATEETSRFKVSSVDQLKGFTRVANTNKLIRTCEKDLWELKEGDDGSFTIERLFDDDGNPLKV